MKLPLQYYYQNISILMGNITYNTVIFSVILIIFLNDNDDLNFFFFLKIDSILQ